MQRKNVMIAGVVLAGFMSSAVHATTWRLYTDAPISEMTSEDVELLRQTVRDTLEQVEDGEIKQWKNPNTGSYGIIKAMDTDQYYGMTCRTLGVASYAADKSAESVFYFCKQKDGSWKILPRPGNMKK